MDRVSREHNACVGYTLMNVHRGRHWPGTDRRQRRHAIQHSSEYPGEWCHVWMPGNNYTRGVNYATPGPSYRPRVAWEMQLITSWPGVILEHSRWIDMWWFDICQTKPGVINCYVESISGCSPPKSPMSRKKRDKWQERSSTGQETEVTIVILSTDVQCVWNSHRTIVKSQSFQIQSQTGPFHHIAMDILTYAAPGYLVAVDKGN